MMRALVVALVAAVAGCHNADPCAGKSGPCLTIEATGSGIPLLDDLAINVRDDSGAEQTGTAIAGADKIALPVQVAALLRAGSSGALSVYVAGEINQAVVAEGLQAVTLPASGHARVTVQLALRGGGGDDLAGGGGAGGDGGGGMGDLAGTGPTLTPPSLDLRVVVNQAGKAIFSATSPFDVTLGAIVISPPVTGLTVDGQSTCQSGMTLSAHATCSVIIDYAPTKPESHTVDVQLATSLGTATSTLRAMSPGLIVETLATGSPPTFKAVHAVDPVHVWAVGDNNAVYRRDASGWAVIPGPGAPATTLDSVWAASDDDVYVGSSGVFSLFRTTDHGQKWDSINAQITAGIEAIAGVDANTIYVASGQGEITVGSAAGFGNDGHPADGIAFDDLEVYAGNVFAARAGQILLRNPAGTPRWNAILDAGSAAHFNATWGSTGGDFYAVGTQSPCAGACSVLMHKVGSSPPNTQSITGCDAIYDVWGEPEGSGFSAYAVGLNGTFVTTPNNDSWSQYTTSTTSALYGVRGASGEIYAVGAFGTILHLVR